MIILIVVACLAVGTTFICYRAINPKIDLALTEETALIIGKTLLEKSLDINLNNEIIQVIDEGESWKIENLHDVTASLGGYFCIQIRKKDCKVIGYRIDD